MMRFAVTMHRLRVAAVVLFAVLLAAQLTLHNHSLIPEGGSAPSLACSVCAFGADRTAPDTPLLAAALVLLGLVAVRTHALVASAVLITTAGRAPPRSL
jgi:heme/copper-type cytochrome/quinol oxidase subunit 3